MAALDAVEIKIFGLNVADDDGTTEFGSTAGGSTAYSDDPAVIQTAAWLEGWQDAVIVGTTKRLPILNDMNSVHYVTTYGLSYLQQEGIGVWLSTKEYRTNSIVKKDGTSELYISLQNSNTNNALTDGAWWQQCGDLQYIPDAALGTAAYVDTGTGSGDIPLIGTSSATDALAGLIEIATNAEVAAGTDTDRAIVPSALASLFGTSSRSTNGYARLPAKVGGAFVEIIIQWGYVAAASIPSVGTNYTVTLPLTYPNANLVVTSPAPTNGSYSASSTANTVVVSKSISNFVFAHGQSPALDVMWISIGY